MYLLDYNHPTDLFYVRREALMREARDARLARELAGSCRTRREVFLRSG